MPFDGIDLTPRTRRALLIAELRNLRDWHWDYRICQRCAMGLAADRFGVPVFVMMKSGFLDYEKLAEAFGMSMEDTKKIFSNLNEVHGCDRYEVTPSMVADALEALP